MEVYAKISFLVFDEDLGEEAELLVTKLTMPASSLAHFRRQAAAKQQENSFPCMPPFPMSSRPRLGVSCHVTG
jgi:hypothetical protein